MSITRVILLALVCATAHGAEPPAPPLDAILSRIEANIAEFETAIPDFVATESVWSRQMSGRKIEAQTRAESSFTCIRNPKPGGKLFLESRQVTKVDGKAVPKGTHLAAPVSFTGGFSLLLKSTFSANHRGYQNFLVSGRDTLNGQPAILITFSSREGQRGMGFVFDGTPHVTNDIGKAWLDPDSLQVMRIERTYSGLPGSVQITMQVDYAKFSIDGRTFWLPQEVNSTQAKGGKAQFEYTAEYRDYRKFSVSTEITFDRD